MEKPFQQKQKAGIETSLNDTTLTKVTYVQPIACKLNTENVWRKDDPPSWIFLPPCTQPLTKYD